MICADCTHHLDTPIAASLKATDLYNCRALKVLVRANRKADGCPGFRPRKSEQGALFDNAGHPARMKA